MQSNAKNECWRHNFENHVLRGLCEARAKYAFFPWLAPPLHHALKTHYAYANKLVPSPVCRVCVYQWICTQLQLDACMDVRKRVCTCVWKHLCHANIHLHVQAFTTRYYMYTHLQCVCVRAFTHPHHRSFIFIGKNIKFNGTHTLNMSTETPGMERQRQNLSASMLQVNSRFQYLEGEKDFSISYKAMRSPEFRPAQVFGHHPLCLGGRQIKK